MSNPHHTYETKFTAEVELLPTFLPRPGITHAVFDFDGTLSWVRHGWPTIMAKVFHRYLPLQDGETADARRDLLEGIIFGLNGRPTIVQMTKFAELARDRASLALDPETLRHEFQTELDVEIQSRLGSIRTGAAPPDAFVVFGARTLLEQLGRYGITTVVLSSTIEHRVREEAAALDLTRYFGERIHGSPPDPTGFLKMDVFRRILHEGGITGENLLSFGDGPVELLCTKELGGIAIAVCSDEEQNGSGVVDPNKRRQLIEAGADAVIPDFRDAVAIVDRLLGK